jgi:hypothetical protein
MVDFTMMLSPAPVKATPSVSIAQPAVAGAYALVWRQKKLVVRRAPFRNAAIVVSAETDMDWLVERVQRSPVKLVLVDARLGVEALRFWAEVTQRAGKVMYVNIKPGKECGLMAQTKSYTLIGQVLRFLLIAILAIVTQCYRLLHRAQPIQSDQRFYVNAQGKVLLGSGLCELIQSHGLREQLWQWMNQLRGRVSLSTAYLLSRDEVCIRSEVSFY